MKQIHRKSGFTLIEILLAIMLMGIIGTSVYGVFSQGLKVEDRLSKNGVGAGEGFWVVHDIARDLENIRPYTSSGGTVPCFEGTHHRITFLVQENGRLQRVNYDARLPSEIKIHREQVNRGIRNIREVAGSPSEEKARHVCVFRSMEPFFDSVNAQSGMDPKEKVLTQDAAVDGLNFFYLNYDDQGQAVWSQQWEEDFWPFAVRIDLTVYDGDQPVRIVRDVFMPLRFFERRRFYEQ